MNTYDAHKGFQNPDIRRTPVSSSSPAGSSLSRYAKYRSRNRFSTNRHGAVIDPSQPSLPPGPAWADDEWYRVRFELACLCAVRPDAIGGQTTAALLCGWPLPRTLRQAGLTVTIPESGRLRRAGVTVRRSQRYDPHTFHTVRLNRADYVLYELARVLTVNELVHVVDAICGPWRTHRIASVASITAGAAKERNVVGKQKLLTALTLACDNVGSPQETWLRLLIVGAGLPTPIVCTPIQLPGADQIYHPDLVYPDARIAIEYEGEHHRTDSWQWDHDIQRERAFRSAGWDYFRVTKRTDIPEFLAHLTAALDERSPRRRRNAS